MMGKKTADAVLGKINVGDSPPPCMLLLPRLVAG